MKRRRNDRRASSLPVAVLIAATSLAACGGIIKVFYKNRQIQVARRIEQIDIRISQRHDELRELRRRTRDMLNCYAIWEELEMNGSELRPIRQDAIEVIPAGDRPGVAMATGRP